MEAGESNEIYRSSATPTIKKRLSRLFCNIIITIFHFLTLRIIFIKNFYSYYYHLPALEIAAASYETPCILCAAILFYS